MLDNIVRVRIEEQDIYGLKVARQSKQYANNSTHDMLKLALYRNNVFPGCSIVVLMTELVVTKTAAYHGNIDSPGDVVTYKLSSGVAEKVALFDDEKYGELNPFDIVIDMYYNEIYLNEEIEEKERFYN